MKRTLDKQIAVEMRLFYALAGTAIIANTLGYVSNAIFYGLINQESRETDYEYPLIKTTGKGPATI